MHVFRKPPESEVLRLLGEAGLPFSDLTPSHLEHFFGCGSEQAPSGVVGLEIHGAEALLRSLVVADSVRGQGYGTLLVAEAERHARECGVEHVYLLTTTAARFFESLGYVAVTRDEAPASIRATSEFSGICPASSVFMMKDLTAGAGEAPGKRKHS
jgi:amino-acid N-acetyltransferase